MLDINQIKQSYTNSLHSFDRSFDRSLLREYLQYHILSILFKHPLSQKLSFLGGTCLRIVHELPRFSEDLNFDNKNLQADEFVQLSNYLQKQLRLLGLSVEVRFITKSAFHCYIKFPSLLYKHGISGQKNEKVLIQLDTFDQGVSYTPNRFILNKFEVLQPILVTSKDVILSQKLWTITQRKRLKGRDFFDIIFLLQNTDPQLEFLTAKFEQQQLTHIIQTILSQLEGTDYKKLADDVRPFLFDPDSADKIVLFPDLLRQKFLT